MHQFNQVPFLTTKRGEPCIKVTCSRCKALATAEVTTPLVDTAIAAAKETLAKKQCQEPIKQKPRGRR